MGRTTAVTRAASKALALGLATMLWACGPDEDITRVQDAAPDEPVAEELSSSHPAPAFEASLRSGDLGGARTDVPPLGGTVLTADGVLFVADAPNGRSNGIVTWNLPSMGVNRADFRASGTISFMIYVDGDSWRGGELIAENFGFNRFRNGQGTFGLAASSITADGTITLSSATWLRGFWDRHHTPGALEPDRWHHVGFTWGGPGSDYELCVDGVTIDTNDTPPFLSLPWGRFDSAEQLGFGRHHERRFHPAASVVGMTVADFRLWTDPVPQCGTEAPAPTNSPPVAVDDLVETAPRTPVVVDVLANDSDPDGDALEVVAVSGSAGNVATVSINPDGTVTWAPLGLDDLEAMVQAIPGLNRGQIRSLMAKLEAAARSLARGNERAASGQLGAFRNQVEAMARTGKIDAATADELSRIVGLILDPPGSDSFTYTISDGELTDDATVWVTITP